MKQFHITRFGLEGLRQTEADEPAPGRGEVLVRWHAWSLNYRDLVTVQGTYLPSLPLPFIPLSDAAGEVVALGEDVTAWRVGDRVVSHYLPDWQDGPPAPPKLGAALGGPWPGLLAEMTVLPERALVALPPHFSYAEGATLPIAALTAWHVLFETAWTPAPGSTALFEGTGGVSLFGLQFARAAGLRTIITSGSDDKLARARELGAHATLNYRQHPHWSREVRRLTDGRGADLILDVGGADTLPEAVRAIAVGGRIALIGFLSGRDVSFNVPELLRSLATLQNVRVGSRAMFARMLAAMDLHRLPPMIDRTFAFADTVEAFRHLAAGGHFGKIVIQGIA